MSLELLYQKRAEAKLKYQAELAQLRARAEKLESDLEPVTDVLNLIPELTKKVGGTWLDKALLVGKVVPYASRGVEIFNLLRAGFDVVKKARSKGGAPKKAATK